MAPLWTSTQPSEPQTEPEFHFDATVAKASACDIHNSEFIDVDEECIALPYDAREQPCLGKMAAYIGKPIDRLAVHEQHCFVHELAQPPSMLHLDAFKYSSPDDLEPAHLIPKLIPKLITYDIAPDPEIAEISSSETWVQNEPSEAPLKGHHSLHDATCYPTAPPLPRLLSADALGGSFKMNTLNRSNTEPNHSFQAIPSENQVSMTLRMASPISPRDLHHRSSFKSRTFPPSGDSDRGRDLRTPPAPLAARTTSRPSPEAKYGSVPGLAEELCPGDVLNIVSQGNAVERIGMAGGFMGHVLLVVSSPQPISRRSEIGRAFHYGTRSGARSGRSLCSVDIVECSRGVEGLNEGKIVLGLDGSGRVLLYGEYDRQEATINDEPEEVLIWHSPALFRKHRFRLDLMSKVLADMRSNQQNWSWSTVVRAFFSSGEISGRVDKHVTMKEIQDSWRAKPICTSVVIVFWQRYLFSLANFESIDPLQLILQVMPLKADRVLPGELFSAMLSRGWSLWQGPTRSLTRDSRGRFISI